MKYTAYYHPIIRMGSKSKSLMFKGCLGPIAGIYEAESQQAAERIHVQSAVVWSCVQFADLFVLLKDSETPEG